MKGFTFSWFTTIFKNSYFLKLQIIYSIFTLAVIMISSFILMNYMNNNLEKELYQSNHRLLTQVQIYADTSLLEKIKSIVMEKSLDTSKDISLNEFFDLNNLSSLASALKVKDALTDLVISNPFIESIYYYRKVDDTLASSQVGFLHDISAPENINKDYINMDLIKSSMTSKESGFYTSPLENQKFWNDKLVFSYTQSIPIFSTPDNRKGCFIVNVDQTLFFNSINKITTSELAEFMIVDSTGRVFSHNELSNLFNSSYQIPELQRILASENGFVSTKIKGKYYGITWVMSSINDWKYISIVPIEILNKEVFLAWKFAGITISLMLLLSIVCLNLITSRLYRPIKKLVASTKERFLINVENTNDLTYMDTVISSLADKMEGIENIVYENKSLINYKLVMDLIHGNIPKESEIQSRMQLLDNSFLQDYYQIVLTEIDKNVFECLPVEQREFAVYKLIDIIKNFLKANNVDAISISHPANCIVTLTNSSERDGTINLKVLSETLYKELGLVHNIAVSKSVQTLMKLDKVYLQTSNYLRYSFLYGYGNIFLASDVERYEKKVGGFNSKKMHNMELMLRSGKTQQIRNEIREFIQSVTDEGYSYTYTYDILMQMIRLICLVSREQKINSHKLNSESLLEDLNNIATLNECMIWLFGIIDQYSIAIGGRNESLNHELIAKIHEYVDVNIEGQLSLYSVANQFKLSSNYFSRFYKETEGTNFSDYLGHKKMEKAAKLLIYEYKTEVTEIAENLGYYNLPYFTKLFKEKYGVTPVQYRKIHR